MKNELEIIKKNENLYIDSREVSALIGKRHHNLMRDISKYIEYMASSDEIKFELVDFFVESRYIDDKGETRPYYLITKKGCDLIAHKMTGKNGVIFSALYINKFDEMEKQLKKQDKLPHTYKEALLQLIAAEEEKERLLLENDRKQELINGFTDEIDIYKKKDIINRTCKCKYDNFANRYKELYKCFRETFHIDLEARCEGYNLKESKTKDRLSVLMYAQKFGHIDNLYECCVKLYETDVQKILKKLINIHNDK